MPSALLVTKAPLVALVAMAAVAELAAAAAKNYTIQWSLSGNYGDWSSNNAVTVGDTVVFTYGPPHTVDELPSEADYKACSFGNSASSDDSGSTAFTFDKAGTRYFACAAGAHCTQGQKVAITAAAAAATPTGASSPAPPKPKENSSAAAAAASMAGMAVKLALGLGVGGAVLAAF